MLREIQQYCCFYQDDAFGQVSGKQILFLQLLNPQEHQGFRNNRYKKKLYYSSLMNLTPLAGQLPGNNYQKIFHANS